MPVFYYNIKFDYDGIAFNLIKDPKSNDWGDIEVIQSVYDQAQLIRNYVLSQYIDNGRYNVSMYELLYNNANRLVTNSNNSNTLLTFLNTFDNVFKNGLYRIIFYKSDIFGIANQAMVTSIQRFYNNNSIDRGLSIYKNKYYPFTNSISS